MLPPDFKIHAATPVARYEAQAGEAEFLYPWPIFSVADLRVFVDDSEKVEGPSSDYVLAGLTAEKTGINEEGGGVVQFSLGLAAGQVVTLVRELPIRRETDFVQGGPLRARQLNDQLDKVIAMLQQLDEQTRRSLRIPVSSDFGLGITTELPRPAANHYLRWDTGGTRIINDPGTATTKIWTVAAPEITGAGTTRSLTYELTDADGATVAADFGAVVMVRVHDTEDGGGASAAATIADIDGTVIDGIGGATAMVIQGSDGKVRFKVSGLGDEAYYVSVLAGQGSTRLVADSDGPNRVPTEGTLT